MLRRKNCGRKDKMENGLRILSIRRLDLGPAALKISTRKFRSSLNLDPPHLSTMAKRRVKKRTHVGAPGKETTTAKNPSDGGPKSLVIRIGASEVGPSVSQLVKDVRRMMEPGTAARLKVRV
jgi:hypothetical protein